MAKGYCIINFFNIERPKYVALFQYQLNGILILCGYIRPCTAKDNNFTILNLAYSIGCYKDTRRRAIRPLEGRSRFLKGNYRRRRDAIRKCFQAAYRRGYKVFALQHQGWCASSRMAHITYRKYGKSNRCRNGKGGPWANDVYVVRGK